MGTHQEAIEQPFRLRQESTRQPRAKRQLVVSRLEAWPTGQGDYYLGGRDTYPIKDRIHATGGRWDSQSKRWYCTKPQAIALGATVLHRVLRAPACCEKNMGPPERGVAAFATHSELMAGQMTVTFCSLCDSRIREVVAIRDIVDPEDVPELPSKRAKPPWED